jgi:polyhydroxyalkanoate synthase
LSAQAPEAAANSFSPAAQALVREFLSALAAHSDPELSSRLLALAAGSPELEAIRARCALEHHALWGELYGPASGEARPASAPDTGDKRFSGSLWRASPHYDYISRSYLINTRFLRDYVEALDLDSFAKQRLRFLVRQVTDALSPANFAATNPEALQLALETQGTSLNEGVKNLFADLQKGRISTTDESAFEVGRNIAISEGAVVCENELMQLIQYSPRTAKVRKRPLLIIPPCINKFYILDLQPENSFLRYAIERGNTVFVVSWRNILAEQGHYTWDDYLSLGVIAALQATRAIGGAEKLNVIGYCVGGTMLGAVLAILKARGDDWIESATFFTALHEFSDPGEVRCFIDESSAAAREATIGKGGVMPGSELALVFSALRANDLIWSYVVNNYLKGKSPDAFDLLYWNADSTNLPGPMYCWYIRNMYLENNLRIPGKLTMLGVPVDLGQVRLPTYVLATREDHIVPWKSSYQTTQLMSGEMRFVLGASGHVAGVVNPASKNRRSYWVNDQLPAQPERWFESATEKNGSWWADWDAWLARFGGAQVVARKKLGNRRYKPIEPAPGRYVKQRVV